MGNYPHLWFYDRYPIHFHIWNWSKHIQPARSHQVTATVERAMSVLEKDDSMAILGLLAWGFGLEPMETSWNFWRKIIDTHPHSLFFCHDILQVPNSGGTKNTRPWHLVVDCTNAPISSSQPRRKARVRALGDGRIYVSWRKATKNSRCFSMEDDDYYNWIQIPF